MKFKYKARTKKGDLKTGIIEASSKETALDLLQKLDLYVTYLEEEKPFIFLKGIRLKRRVSQKDIILFTRQLSILSSFGVSLTEALFTISVQTKNLTLKEKIVKIAEDVEGGSSLSFSFSKHPDIFSSFYVEMIKAGEMTGKLSFCLNQLADFLEKNYGFRQKIIGAMIYPTIVLILFFGVLLFLTFFVFPTFKDLFLEAGLELPLLTRTIFAIASFLREKFLFLLFLLTFFFFALLFLLSKKEGKKAFDKILLKFPMLGSFLKEIYLTRIAQNLYTFLSGGVHLMLALESTADLVGNSVYKDAILKIKEKIKEGAVLSFCLSFYPDLFSPFFVQIISTGEKTGALEKALTDLVNFQQNEIERRLESFLKMLEPTMIMIIALFVGFLIASVIIPIYRLIMAY